VQVASQLLMVRPAAFAYNTQTAGSNKFQRVGAIAHETVHEQALKEFDEAVATLRKHDIDLVVVDDSANPLKPDAIFPNNWFSVHDDCIILYPMAAPNRRLERRKDVLSNLSKNQQPFKPIIDLSQFENGGKFLEGTGSLVLDRVHKIAYAAVSERTHPDLVKVWCEAMNYTPVLFHATVDEAPVYHTNVLMAIGEKTAIVSVDAIAYNENGLVEKSLGQHRTLVRITVDQTKAFAGNALLVQSKNGVKHWVMSRTAFKIFTESQRQVLTQDGALLPLNIRTIEAFGGGSARCMLAETAW